MADSTPVLTPPLATAVLEYDAAIKSCASDPDRMASFCSAQGDDLDALYDRMVTAAASDIGDTLRTTEVRAMQARIALLEGLLRVHAPHVPLHYPGRAPEQHAAPDPDPYPELAELSARAKEKLASAAAAPEQHAAASVHSGVAEAGLRGGVLRALMAYEASDGGGAQAAADLAQACQAALGDCEEHEDPAREDPWPTRNSPENREILGCPDGYDCVWWPTLGAGDLVRIPVNGRRPFKWLDGTVLHVDGSPSDEARIELSIDGKPQWIDPLMDPCRWFRARATTGRPQLNSGREMARNDAESRVRSEGSNG